jgi:HK97 family phage portal protein
VILATRAGDLDVREANVGAILAAQGLTRGSRGTAVSAFSVAGIPAAKEAIRIAAEAVATLELGVFRGRDVERRRILTTWQGRLFSGSNANEIDSWFHVLEATEASLTARNNGFWLKEKNLAGQVAQVRVLHPDCVRGRWNKKLGQVEYAYQLEGGGWSAWVSSGEVLHFRVGHVSPGSLFAPTPLELHREQLRNALSKQRYESDFYDDGVMQQLGIVLDERVTPEQAREYGEVYEEQFAGLQGRKRVRVIGGAKEIRPIGLSLEDSQYVESMQFTVEDMARIFGMLPSFLNAGRESAKPLSPEHEQMRWHTLGLEPRLARISSTINADPDFFGPAARDYVAFSGVRAQADTTAQSEALVREVQAGILLPDEARALKGLPPHKGGVGQIPQITPVGGAPNPELAPAPAPDEDDDTA